MFASLNAYLTAGGPPSDPYFYDVSLLLNGDGTNGAQNNTFLDSSSNAFTITRNGNTTQGSFSPYGSLWSNYFGGSGNYILGPSNAAFNFGTGDFTIEAWVNPLDTSYNSIFFNASAGGGTAGWLGIYTNQAYWYSAGASDLSGGTIPIGAWTHIAVSRVSGTNRLFVNGSLVSSSADSIDYNGTTCSIGRYINDSTAPYKGNISNLRVVKGTGLYTSSFTPSKTPLPVVSGTSLLTCQSNRFIDNSTNAFTLTPTGAPSVQRFSPFNPTSAYSTSVIGGSAYANDNGYLSSTGSLGSIGTGDFTVEGWVYPTTYTYSNIVLNIADDQTTTGISFYTYQNTLRVYSATGYLSYSGALNLNSWNHVAWVRQSGVITAYLNGVSVGSGNYANNISSSGFRVGGELNSGTLYTGLQGYMTDVRLVNSAIYTTTFTPPTLPLTAVSGTQLLTNMTNAGIPDLAMQNDLQTVGNAQVSTSVKKYGTGSLSFDGSGDYLVSNPATPDLYAFGTGDFTIEFWIYFNSVSGVIVIFDPRNSTETNCPVLYMSSGTLLFYVNGVDRASGGALTTNTWYHIALCKSGTSTRLFVNGVQPNVTYTDTNNYTCQANRPIIGANGYVSGGGVGLYPLNGYIDDLRITKGLARYTANFTPPTTALPTY